MRKSKVYQERYELAHQDLVKILGLDHNQKITDIIIGPRNGGSWSLTCSVETTESKTIEVPTFTDK